MRDFKVRPSASAATSNPHDAESIIGYTANRLRYSACKPTLPLGFPHLPLPTMS